MGGRTRNWWRGAASFALYALTAALVVLPTSVEFAIERARFDDRLGAFPVEVALSHNGYSTIDTGLMGKLYWERTGRWGFGAELRATGPPEAGGTLASYVTPAFLETNTAFVDHPDELARAYGAELRSQVIRSVLLSELVAALVGGALLGALFRGRMPPTPRLLKSSPARAVAATGYVLVPFAVSVALSGWLFTRWSGDGEVGETYPMPGVAGLSFSSPQAREVAQQVRPFVEKNTRRIEQHTARFRQAAATNLEQAIPAAAQQLAPRADEVLVLAEADPQGSRVATDARADLYGLLTDHLDGGPALRTISGDMTSNGTVAEAAFVRSEAAASPGIPVAAVKGDHDSENTVEQMEDTDLNLLDREVEDLAGLRVTGAADPAYKSLFGGVVINESGVSARERGRELRDAVGDEEPLMALVHQPATAAGYLGIDAVEALPAGRFTTPHDDGVPDVPAGTVSIGHRHDTDGPWVLWNTDGDRVTWTVVHQLGTSGGVEELPTFNHFSTPFSVPLKDVTVHLQYVNKASGLQTGLASIVIAPSGSVTISDRVDIGLPGGQPGERTGE